MASVWNYIQEFMIGMSAFWQWLVSPIEALGGWRPISVIGVTGLGVILGFWVIKLINPLS